MENLDSKEPNENFWSSFTFVDTLILFILFLVIFGVFLLFIVLSAWFAVSVIGYVGMKG